MPLGSRAVTGIVVDVSGDSNAPAGTDIKPLRQVLDTEPFIPSDVVDLARWTAEYYAAGAGEAITAVLPPKTREATFRRARLCQFATDESGAFLPPGVWDDLSTGVGIPDGAEVVVALDGSFSDDTTALLVATVSDRPHLDVVGVWEPAEGERIPIAEVEQAVRDACKRWQVVEIVADPFRWQRTLQALEAEKLPIVEFPHSPARLTAATSDLYGAATNGLLTHSGDARLAAHIGAAVIREDARGMRLDKASRRRNARKIDLAACAVMAHSRATWRATRPKKRRRAKSFAA